MVVLVEECGRNLQLSVNVTAKPYLVVAIIQEQVGSSPAPDTWSAPSCSAFTLHCFPKRAGVEPPARLFFTLADPSGHLGEAQV